MNRLQLATILSWAGDSGLQGRKRLQKVVFFLQQAGCKLDCTYRLHHFGPYSRDVADVCDEMVAADLLEEKEDPQARGKQYNYKLTPRTQELLEKADDQSMQAYVELGTTLINEEIWTLELGSTIQFYFGKIQDWDEALQNACKFKDVPPSAPGSEKALALAQKVQAGN